MCEIIKNRMKEQQTLMVLTLLEKLFKLLPVFQASLQVSQSHVSLKQRALQRVYGLHTAVDHLPCGVVHLDRLPVTWTKAATPQSSQNPNSSE